MHLFYGFLIGLILFSSCSSDDNSGDSSASIIGKWKLTAESYGGDTYVLNSTIETLNDSTLRYKFISDNEEGTFPESEQSTQTYNRIE